MPTAFKAKAKTSQYRNGRGVSPRRPPSRSNRGAAETHPTPAVRTQSCVFGFGRKSPIFTSQAEYARCAMCVIHTWRVLYPCLTKAFGDASSKTWILRRATFSFCASTRRAFVE